MTRTQAIAIITAKLEAADDHTLEAVAAHLSTLEDKPLTVGDVLANFPTETALARDLSTRERDLIDQSKADFAAGRTYSTEDVFEHIDAQRAARRAAPTKA